MVVKKSVALVLAIVLLGALVVPPLADAQRAGNGGALTVPINTANFAGTFTITNFVRQADQVLAVGTVVGTTIGDAGTAGITFVRQVAVPLVSIEQAPNACQILTLVLGPLHLDLLGLVVDLNQVVLNITAEPGPGNLLGNLLCAIAGILDPTGGLATNLARLVELLNRLLGSL